MLVALCLVPVMLSTLVMAAHFLRSGNWLMLLVTLVLPLLLLTRKRWAARLMQVLLLLGGALWLWTMYQIAVERQAQDQPWLRMAVILSVVALVTAGSSLLFLLPPMRRVFSR